MKLSNKSVILVNAHSITGKTFLMYDGQSRGIHSPAGAGDH